METKTRQETPLPPPPPPPSLFPQSTHFNRSEVDTTRAFRSVKEAVAIFGERFLASQIHTSKPTLSSPSPLLSGKYSNPSPPLLFPPPRASSSSSIDVPPNTSESPLLEKFIEELEETKREVKELKARETETEIVVASLNAEVHKNSAKLAAAEATAAALAAMKAKGVVREEEEIKSEGNKNELVLFKRAPSLAQVLGMGEETSSGDGYKRFTIGNSYKKKKKKQQQEQRKKKPIIPLITEFFRRSKKDHVETCTSKYISSYYNNSSLYYC
ncbi:WEB family protein At2g17940 [Amborella trichopoda]|uniref:WEB family protein n=1 Tax=Amborella trichopoda TaxID=13333 RepID=W1NNX4_AMBTC|nr:WEB family protein At2g17940 [Amborella trichopoda]ERM97736.1 hypothetical protein AMTR_s00121p00131440 [Amborella trichopoda]|eukprot:XP_006830320.1 WEB family protein At2g17940 [Amborella trichopoda]